MPPIIVFCAFTRLEMMDRWFNDLASTDLDPSTTSFAFIIDTGEDERKMYARIMEEMNKVPYRKFLIRSNVDHYVNPVNIPIRRRRIAEVKNQSKALIAELEGDYVLSLEDDTVFTNLSVKELLKPFMIDEYLNKFDALKSDQKIGMVSAYEAGRWYAKIIGIWSFDNALDPRQCWTELPEFGFKEIDAAGFYCYLTPKELYLAHDYHWEEYEPWGPDVNYGLWLRQQGFTNYVDWNQPCGHNDGEVIIEPRGDLYSESFHRDMSPEFDNGAPVWIRRKQA